MKLRVSVELSPKRQDFVGVKYSYQDPQIEIGKQKFSWKHTLTLWISENVIIIHWYWSHFSKTWPRLNIKNLFCTCTKSIIFLGCLILQLIPKFVLPRAFSWRRFRKVFQIAVLALEFTGNHCQTAFFQEFYSSMVKTNQKST